MGINSKIAEIPFWVLYCILAVFTSFNWIMVILFQTNFDAFKYTQPWDYYLSKFFANTFGTTQKQYFIFLLPILLILLFLIPKLFGKLMSLDKNSNVKGDNHITTLLILLTIPSLVNMPAISGVTLVVVFSLISWFDEQKAKQKI